MNRVRHLTSPRNPASNESTIVLRTIELTQEGWDGKEIIAPKLPQTCDSHCALLNGLAAGSR